MCAHCAEPSPGNPGDHLKHYFFVEEAFKILSASTFEFAAQ